MTGSFTLVDSLALGDLQVFLGRAARVDEGSVRLIGGAGVLAVYVSVLHPAGLLDQSPTVLGLRTFALSSTDDFDAVVPVRSLLGRIESAVEASAASFSEPVAVNLPMSVNTVTWAAISPPRGGWVAIDSVPSAVLEEAARAGIEEVAAAIPTGTGEAIVHKVRTEVWGRPLDEPDYVPAGAGFAAVSLGFLADDEAASVFESGAWTRLSTKRGHILVKRRAWSVAR
ncbi:MULTISPECIES: hypothetical protein [unclassified Salinibacterium]|uniref:hypothetical protein n=1 Tax=unclassified Salinibacterium TaxID=2632331 RepID=UPI0018CD4ED0|nr:MULTISPECIES: hypothetical protein [unclassified Salinibacterium]MBH0053857.1 hypothetical protein [Salinibacterium sp. SWN139]MBH0083118.1 hypothetical protein [Salinibacterium sp. SWN167]MBH0115839.1 hypothetical protein [Salinibacterium sp. NG253]MBH0129371.1 hypothetical protein [Salinibacterium sp. NK8237]